MEILPPRTGQTLVVIRAITRGALVIALQTLSVVGILVVAVMTLSPTCFELRLREQFCGTRDTVIARSSCAGSTHTMTLKTL